VHARVPSVACCASLRGAVDVENRFRSNRGMPLLPELSLDPLAESLLDRSDRSG
jgi:hypothetical protein